MWTKAQIRKKKPDGTDKASGEKSSSGNGDAIITPLKVSIEEKQTARSAITRSDSVKRAYVIAGLLFIITGKLTTTYWQGRERPKAMLL